MLAKIVDLECHDSLEGIVTFRATSGNDYQAYFWGYNFVKHEIANLNFSPVLMNPDWDKTFTVNKDKEKKLIPSEKRASYQGYGEIKSINPIIADFGDLELNLGDWSNDIKLIGQFIYCDIDRLELALP